MNLQADPVGYKALSRHFANATRFEAESAEEVRDQGVYIRMSAYALVTLAVLAIMTLLHETRPVAMPVVLGIVVGLIFAPLGDKVARFGIPAPVTTAVVVLGGIAAFGGVLYLVSPTIGDFAQVVPRLSEGLNRITKSVEALSGLFQTIKQSTGAGGAIVTEARTSTVDVAAKVGALVVPAISQLMIFFFTLLLFVASRQEIRNLLVMQFKDRDQRLTVLRMFGRTESLLTEYVLAVTAINIGLGVVVAGTFFLFGIPGALVWGVLAFVVNFLPVIGPLLLKGLLLIFGIALYPTALQAMLPLALFLVISLVEANLVTPRIVGKKVTMSPLMVFLAVVFWTWLWGFAGAFVAMPLLAIISVVRDQIRDTQAGPSLPG